jgi:anti-anti-sigma factor
MTMTMTTASTEPTDTVSIRVDSAWRSAVVVVTGDLDLVSAPYLRRLVRGLQDGGTVSTVTLDLRGVRFLDVQGLRAVEEASRVGDDDASPVHVVVVPGAVVARLRGLVKLAE